MGHKKIKHFSKGDKIVVKFKDGTSSTGVVQSQTGTMLKIKWDEIFYRPQDEPDKVDYREVDIANV